MTGSARRIGLGIVLIIVASGVFLVGRSSDEASIDRTWLTDTARPGSVWDGRSVIARLGRPEISGSSTLGSRMTTNYHFPSVGMTVAVDEMSGTVTAVE